MTLFQSYGLTIDTVWITWLVLQQDLKSHFNWSNHWKLSFNGLKCILIHFSTSCPAVNVSNFLNQHQLSVTNSHKDLGIIVSSNLDWTDHYNYISGQAYKIFCNCNSTLAKKILYLSLVCPKLTYCSCVWRSHLIKDITTLENIQRRATKFILNDYTSDYKSRLLKLNMFPLVLLYEYYDIIFFFKCLKSPSSAFDITKLVSFFSTSTRSSANFKLYHSKSSTNNCRHFYFNRLPRLWNSLPVFSLHLPLSSFKLQLKNILWSKFKSHFDASNPCSFNYMCPCRNCSVSLSSTHKFTQAVS